MPDPNRLTSRLNSIDALRGLVMIIMAIDHVRDFVYVGATSNPTNLQTTSVALFLTRWITHYVAPTFMFTAGLGAFFRGRSKGPADLAKFLLTRGLWLMFLEITVMRVAFDFNLSLAYPWLVTILWGIGISMVMLAAFVRLPKPWLVVIALVMIAGHNALDGVTAESFGPAGWLWHILHQVGAFQVAGKTVVVTYPVIPWLGVMMLGFCAGALWDLEPDRRQRILFRAGLAATAAFVVVRGLNVYGDPAPWAVQGSMTFTVLSFLNTTKYAPSLEFLLMTLGPAAMMLSWFERRQPLATNPLVILGRVPLFYFVAHFYLGHLVSKLLAFTRYGSEAAGFFFYPPPAMGFEADKFPPGYGYSLPVTYLIWASIVLALYPACKWFAGVKARRKDWWLSYL